MKEPKYKIGQKFQDDDDIYALKITIVGISPKIDYHGFYAYFVEIVDSTGENWYMAYEEDYIDEWLTEVD